MPVTSLPTPSIAPICPYFYECGGCDLQDVPYAEQTAYKEASLKALFAGMDTQWQPFLGSLEEYPVFYRNKMRFAFVMHQGKLRPSRHAKGDDRADIPVDECFLQSPESNRLINWIADWGTEHHWQPYLPSSGIGWLKHVLIRQSRRTGEMLVSLVTSEGSISDSEAFSSRMLAELPFVSGLYHTETRGRDNFTFEDHHLAGATHIHETIGESRYRIALHAFFQTNSAMVETLYDAVLLEVTKAKPKNLWDLYAGSATIGIHVASGAEKVVCIESNPANVADGEWNISENTVANVTMVGGEVETAINSALLQRVGSPDMIVVDPPRAGLSEKTRTMLSGLRPKTLVYVSCNPMTLLRDLKDLQKRGFNVETLRGVDMFPHTLHCEAIAVLSR